MNVYKYSVNRNKRIKKAIEFYRFYGYKIVPIYFSPTDYERHFKTSDEEKDGFTPAISICINQIPEIIESKLTWEQVLNVRKDTKALTKIRRFKNWMTLDFTGKSESEIRDSLEKSLDGYSWALRKHGIQTAAGAISTVNSVSSALISAINGDYSFLLPGIIIGSGVAAYAVQSFVNVLEVRRHPIAIIYDLLKSK